MIICKQIETQKIIRRKLVSNKYEASGTICNVPFAPI